MKVRIRVRIRVTVRVRVRVRVRVWMTDHWPVVYFSHTYLV